MWRHFTTTTPIYNQACLYYTSIGGYGPYNIRLRISSYRIASQTAKLKNVTAIPAYPSFSAPGFNRSLYGSNFLVEQPSELPKLVLQGHMDTPMIQASEYVPLATPNTKVGVKVQSTVLLAGQPVSYGDLITIATEGRAGATKAAAVDPDYFIDAFGRQFNKPRIVEFSASYLQGVPFRQNFNITLQLTRGSSS